MGGRGIVPVRKGSRGLFAIGGRPAGMVGMREVPSLTGLQSQYAPLQTRQRQKHLIPSTGCKANSRASRRWSSQAFDHAFCAAPQH
eukprot:scaffold125029_cov19-Tisochrysis_lutea.AAC.2